VLVRALGAAGAVRCVAVDATEVAQRTAEVHGLSHGSAWLAAEALVANCLLSGHIKGEEQISLQIRSDDPACDYYGQVSSEGVCRARLAPAEAQIRIGEPVSGLLIAVKSIVNKELYRGASLIAGETLEQAMARYMRESAQIPAILRMCAEVESDGTIAFAGGIIVERLADEPGMPSVTREAFEDRFTELADIAPRTVVSELQAGRLLDDPVQEIWRRPLEWRCRCSRERTEGALVALGRATLMEMIDEDGGAEITCNFCGTAWQVSVDRLLELADPS
jgi:molecular chaperone Hsp33